VSADTSFFYVFFIFWDGVVLRGREAEEVSGLSGKEVPGMVVEAVGAENLKEPVEVVSWRFRFGVFYPLHVFRGFVGHHMRCVRHANVAVIFNPSELVVTALSSQEVLVRFVNFVNERFYFIVGVAALGRVIVVGVG